MYFDVENYPSIEEKLVRLNGIRVRQTVATMK